MVSPENIGKIIPYMWKVPQSHDGQTDVNNKPIY